MRVLLIFFLIVTISITLKAQTTGGFGSNSSRMIPMGNLGPSEEKEDIQGKFLRQEWSPGIVSFRNSVDKWHVPLIFDVYSNKVYFLQDKQVMEFVDTVSEFTIFLIRRDDSFRVTFRGSYPPINPNTAETFYEVLVDGQFQLLKCKAKTIYLYKEQNLPEEQRKYNKELLYAYFPGKQMVLVKEEKEQFLSQVPQEFLPAVQSIVDAKKLKLKNEESLRQLFIQLNQE